MVAPIIGEETYGWFLYGISRFGRSVMSSYSCSEDGRVWRIFAYFIPCSFSNALCVLLHFHPPSPLPPKSCCVNESDAGPGVGREAHRRACLVAAGGAEAGALAAAGEV